MTAIVRMLIAFVVQCGTSCVLPPRQGPAAGNMSPVLGWPPHARRSRPRNLGVRAHGRRRHHGDRKATRRIASDRTGRGMAHERGAKGMPGRQAAGHNQGTRAGARQTRPPQRAHTTPEHAGPSTRAQARLAHKNRHSKRRLPHHTTQPTRRAHRGTSAKRPTKAHTKRAGRAHGRTGFKRPGIWHKQETWGAHW